MFQLVGLVIWLTVEDAGKDVLLLADGDLDPEDFSLVVSLSCLTVLLKLSVPVAPTKNLDVF